MDTKFRRNWITNQDFKFLVWGGEGPSVQIFLNCLLTFNQHSSKDFHTKLHQNRIIN